MSSSDRGHADLLAQALRSEREANYSHMSEGDYFEFFIAEQLLKDYDLDDDEILSGQVGGGGDGGLDGVYTFVNGVLVHEDTVYEEYRRGVEIDLVILQGKEERSFRQATLDALNTSLAELLDLTRDDLASMTQYNSSVRTQIGIFRAARAELANKLPRVRIRIVYASHGDAAELHPDVQQRGEVLRDTIRRLLPDAGCALEFVGARELVELGRQDARTTATLNFTDLVNQTWGDGDAQGYLGLVSLDEYARFITADDGQLRRQLFEANVRDYQGGTEVNNKISGTLAESPPDEDFWWLNNGVTVIADGSGIRGKTLTLENPQIVNGLQTSMEVYHHRRDHGDFGDDRQVQVRVVIPEGARSVDRIIRATNSQTKIPDASLRATDPLQRDIEDYLENHGLHYDRRKNFHKNQGVARSSIVTIPEMAQAVSAILGQRPDTSRARPSTLIKGDTDYNRVFDAAYPLDAFLRCAQILQRVNTYIRAGGNLDQAERNNLRFHVAMAVAAVASQRARPRANHLAAVNIDDIDDALLGEATQLVRDAFRDERAARPTETPDQVGKSRGLVERLDATLEARYRPAAAASTTAS